MNELLWAGPLMGFLFMAMVLIFLAMAFRIVVSTNEVHIVQSGKTTTSFGKGQDAGNVYYRWPSWVPYFGVKVIILPVSVFSVELEDYPAYDVGRVPFTIDVMAFFRIDDSNTAAQRVQNVDELRSQLLGILQGAIRSILASSEITEILGDRASFGARFTESVEGQLQNWGVTNVKNIELMDIRDREHSKVIENIMAKKKSLIESESRVAVAENLRVAQEAEIAAQREVALKEQEAQQTVGERIALTRRQVGIADQKSLQDIKEEERATEVKAMAVKEVTRVRAAEIEKQGQVILAEQNKQQTIIDNQALVEKAKLDAERVVVTAEADAKQVTVNATAALEAAKREAEGIEARGKAKGEADKAVLMAPVVAQLTLAEKIGANKEYQTYLLTIEQIKALQAIGVAQAAALESAEIKVIANGGTVTNGLTGITDLFSSKGGTALASLLEGLAQSDAGKGLIETIGKSTK
jgi:flotillin